MQEHRNIDPHSSDKIALTKMRKLVPAIGRPDRRAVSTWFIRNRPIPADKETHLHLQAFYTSQSRVSPGIPFSSSERRPVYNNNVHLADVALQQLLRIPAKVARKRACAPLSVRTKAGRLASFHPVEEECFYCYMKCWSIELLSMANTASETRY